jgi:hypothetical protein
MQKIFVTNARGEQEPFSFRKVFTSAKRAGASSKIATEVALTIQEEMVPGMKTFEIFQKVKKILSEHDYTSAVRFNLKEAIRRLGPDGFSFEKYMASIFSKLGYRVVLNQHLKGRCVPHEIDFVAENDSEIIIGECKYRISGGDRIDIKICLSNYATFLDLKEGYFKNSKKELKMLLVTNAKFTNHSIKYAQCAGIELLGWRFPVSGGLESMIESQNLYPITILPSFKGVLTNLLATHDRMLVSDLLNANIDELSRHTGVPKSKLATLIDEAKVLMEKNGKKENKIKFV